MRVPGESASVVTCLDGHEMAKQGRAGAALAVAALGSFVAGTLSILGLMLLAPALVSVALAFGPTEYFALMVLGLVLASTLTGSSVLKGQLMVVVGLFLSMVGIDTFTSFQRFTFGIVELWSGFEIVPLVVGLFAVSEVLHQVERGGDRIAFTGRLSRLWPTGKDLRDSTAPILRGSLLGFFLGILPGAGAILCSFASYGLERSLSRHPERFGSGAIEGVAGPESANNAATSGAFVPLLALGLPGNAVMALMLGALLIHGVQPGPRFLLEQPRLFWTFIASMYLGNAMLLVLNLPLVGVWARLLTLPRHLLMALVLLFCVIGTYVVNNSIFDLWVMLLFGVAGYLLERSGYPLAPLVLAFVLGRQMEFTLRQALLLAGGNVFGLLTHPIAVGMFALAALAVLAAALRGMLLALLGRRALDARDGSGTGQWSQ